jgi:hypothetical protein
MRAGISAEQTRRYKQIPQERPLFQLAADTYVITADGRRPEEASGRGPFHPMNLFTSI